jgi:hypothetical protein
MELLLQSKIPLILRPTPHPPRPTPHPPRPLEIGLGGRARKCHNAYFEMDGIQEWSSGSMELKTVAPV